MTATKLDLDALEALEKAATPGPWRFRGDDDSYPHRHLAVGIPRVGMLDNVDADPQFVAAARNALPALIAAARRLEDVESALAFLRAGNFAGAGGLSVDYILAWAKEYGWDPKSTKGGE